MMKLTLNKLTKAVLIGLGGVVAWNYLKDKPTDVRLSGDGLSVAFDPIAEAVPESNNNDVTITHNASIKTIMQEMYKIVDRTLWQTEEVAKRLRRPTEFESVVNLFIYLLTHFKYKNDEWGFEQLREPIRSFKDRHSGIDCDCFSILIGSVLRHWGIRFFFRAVCYKRVRCLAHVYPVAVINNNEVPLDVVSRRFAYEKNIYMQ